MHSRLDRQAASSGVEASVVIARVIFAALLLATLSSCIAPERFRVPGERDWCDLRPPPKECRI